MQNEVNKSLEILENQKLLLNPTDTVWGIGCDATSKDVVERIFKIIKRSESISLIILVDSIEMLQKYIPKIPDKVLNFIKTISKPTTIIYKNLIGLASNVIASDNTIAIRIVRQNFCNQLITRFGKPIISTSANSSNDPTPKSFKEIETSILDRL
jgi:L-threonylcarbamoyladenylate synthase